MTTIAEETTRRLNDFIRNLEEENRLKELKDYAVSICDFELACACRDRIDLLPKYEGIGKVSDTIRELRKAGLDAWDDIENPEDFIKELRE